MSTLGALLLAVVVGIGIFTYRNVEVWTPLQQWYWIQYLNTKNFPIPSGGYQMISKLDRRGQRSMAIDADVVPAPPHGRQWIAFALTATSAPGGGGRSLVVDNGALQQRANESDSC